MQIINEYFTNVYSTGNYLKKAENSRDIKIIIIFDILKCIAIGSTLAAVLRYARGSCHYTKFAKSIAFGALFGFSYSFYFTNEKL